MNTKACGRIVVGAMLAFVWHTSIAAGAAELGRDANASLQKLYASVPAAKAVGAKAQSILVFPKVTDKAGGFEVGVGPTVVVVDEGKAKTMTTTTAKDDIYAFIFGQKGLMAGLGIQGNKITKINPK